MTEEIKDSVWMTRVEASQVLGVCLRTVHRWMASGKLVYTRDVRTGRVLIKVDSVKSETSVDLLG